MGTGKSALHAFLPSCAYLDFELKWFWLGGACSCSGHRACSCHSTRQGLQALLCPCHPIRCRPFNRLLLLLLALSLPPTSCRDKEHAAASYAEQAPHNDPDDPHGEA